MADDLGSTVLDPFDLLGNSVAYTMLKKHAGGSRLGVALVCDRPPAAHGGGFWCSQRGRSMPK